MRAAKACVLAPLLREPWRLAVSAWLGILIATPLVMWLVGEALFPALTSLGVLSQTAAVVLALRSGWSWSRSLLTLGAIAALAWGVEATGAATGVPFGHYDYTPALQPQWAGVPLLIPLAWSMLLVPAWAIAEAILAPLRARWETAYPLAHAALSATAFTAWDLYLDPQMVARGLWTWEQPGAYFGIPLVNYAGWWLSALAISLVLRPFELPQRPLVWIYTLTWAFQAVGLGLFWGQPGPALAGFLGMGIFVLAAWHALQRQSRDLRMEVPEAIPVELAPATSTHNPIFLPVPQATGHPGKENSRLGD